jgi:hypothetical protein
MWEEGTKVDWQMKTISEEADRLLELADDDASLRADLRSLAEKILERIADPPGDDDRDRANPAVRVLSDAMTLERPAPVAPGLSDRRRPSEPLRELTLGRSVHARNDIKLNTRKIPEAEVIADQLAPIEARCGKKAEAARWAAAHERWLQQGADLEDEGPSPDPEVTRWADTLTDGFYWGSASDPSQSADISLLDDLGGCFEAVAESLALVRIILDEKKAAPRALEEALPLVAEAQSSLRAAMQRMAAPEDADQLQVFDWLKITCARSHIYVKRFMRADDPADPLRWPDLLARIEKQRARHGPSGRGPEHEEEFNRLRSLLDGIREGRSAEPDWQAVIEVVEEIVGKGVPPSNREVRELLLPVIDELPDLDDLPQGFRLVLREIDRFLATHSSRIDADSAPEPTAEVKEAARLLTGKSVALIGGSRRREAQESLRKTLGLKELIWLETKEHQSVGSFEPLVARSDVALVLLAIRWSSHAFGDVKKFCDRHGKLLVRLPGGYSPNQVAAQVVSQCSAQLTGE